MAEQSVTDSRQRGAGQRRLNGALLDVRHAAQFLGVTEKTLRARVARRVVPFRRFGGRVVFLKTELESFLSCLDGCTRDEALGNMYQRLGQQRG
jgi:excisionase family DNA binding protein